MKPINELFSGQTGLWLILGISLFAAGLAAGNRTLWIVGLCLVAFGLLTSTERDGRR